MAIGRKSDEGSRFNLSHRDKIAAIQRRRYLRMGCNTPVFSPSLPIRSLPRLLARSRVLLTCIHSPTWSNVVRSAHGVILAPGRHTVTAALRILGRDRDPDFCTFHRILKPGSVVVPGGGGQLLIMLIKAFVPSGAPIVIGLDDTIERRLGPKISARGIYRDPVRSSKGHFVKASGLRWLSAIAAGARAVGRPHHGAALSHPARPLQNAL